MHTPRLDLPLYSAYVASLPDGLDSHPDCQAKGSMLRIDLEGAPCDVPDGLLPPEIDALLREPPLNSQWIPETHNVAAHLAAYDLRFGDDWDAAEDHIYTSNRSLLESPLYRALFLLAGPRLLMKGAQFRWGQLHKGVGLEVVLDKGGQGGTVHLTYPENLFTNEFVQGIGMGFKALLEANEIRQLRHELAEYSPTHAAIVGNWSNVVTESMFPPPRE